MRLPAPQDTYDRQSEQKMRNAIETSIADIERKLSTLLTTRGTLAAGAQDITLANGTNNNISVGYATYVRISGPSSAFTITGIANPERGRVLILRNTTGQTMTISNDSASSTAQNRIYTQSGTSVTLRGSGGQTAIFIYDATQQRWILSADEGASGMGVVATRTELAATPSSSYAAMFLSEAGREGIFTWTSSDVSSLVTYDTNQAVYVPPSSAPTGASGAWVRVFSNGLSIAWAGCVPDGTTNNKAAIQSCIDVMWARGGGVVFIPEGIWGHSGDILLHQTVTLEGEGNAYVNLYSSTDFTVRGSVLKLITGSNTSSIQVRYKKYGSETLSAPDNVRHQGGLRNLTIWGNRSDTQTPSSITNNSTGGSGGHGVMVRGVSNVYVNDVLVVRCSGDGFNIGSFDYGAGTISSNNMMWTDVQSLSNAGRGFLLAGGDQDFHKLTAGYNALNGFSISSGNSSFTGCRAWNNQAIGFYVSIDFVMLAACNSYDNYGAGFYLDAADTITLTGVIAARNGVDTGLPAGQRSGVFMANSDNVVIDGAFVDDGISGGPFQQYGVYNNSVNNTVKYGAMTFKGNVVAQIGGATTAAKRMPCIQTVNTTNQFTTSTSYVSSTVSATIYPSSVGASIRVTVDATVGASAALIASLTLYRGATDLTPAGVNGFKEVYVPDTNTVMPVSFTFVDSPLTNAATTYTLYWKTSTATARLGRRQADTTIDVPTIITLEEVYA